jgi:hypothetical protein
MATPTRPSRETRDAEREEADRKAGADREPTEDEERLAEQHTTDESVAEHEAEMLEKGAHQEGEGRVP